ncbi:MAG: hypothetical protein AVO34_09480 [Firmicutes bacterium ML8_F2]|nr:MAG: hypothetical protein AVO34_09480 [Firmicutes bacterium ML8_F2]
MIKLVKSIAILVVIFLAILFIIFVINQTGQAVRLAGEVHPLLSRITLFALLALYAAVIIIPLAAFFSRPTALIPPQDNSGEANVKYLQRLAKRLKRNPALENITVDPAEPASIKEALATLDRIAETRVKDAASNIFILTAISQYGALDAIIVLLTQLRMIWQVAGVYNQRPNLRELSYLYSNVFATAFLATRIENLELLEDQLEPVIASIMGSSLSSLTPTFNNVANIITNSVIQGSANAFLTLRVGVITLEYCSSLVKPEKNTLRRIAAARATTLLAKVLSESTYKVTRAILRATAKTGKRPFIFGQNLINKTTHRTREAGRLTLQKSEQLARDISEAVKRSSHRLKNTFGKPETEEDN